MKLKYTILTIAFTIISVMSGCKKYNCHCISTRSTYNPGDGPTSFTNKVRGGKAKAQATCDSFSSPIDTYGNETKCTLQ